MATVTATATETIPRTANLLACKQWWRVCFLYGDQEKYYRQVYGKAASQRIAASSVADKKNGEATAADSGSETTTISGTVAGNGRFGNGPTPTLFPTKQPSRRRSKMNAAERLKQSMNPAAPIATRKEDIKPNRRITVLDDPFLFGMNEHANLSEDSGIDNAAFETSAPPPLKPKKIQRHFNDTDLHRDLCYDLKINENELRLLHLSRRNRSGVAIAPSGGVANESFSFSSESEEQRDDQGSPSSSTSSMPPPLSPRRRDVPPSPNGHVGQTVAGSAKE